MFGQRLGDEGAQRIDGSQQEKDRADQEGFEEAQVAHQRPNEHAAATNRDYDVLRRNKIKEIFHCLNAIGFKEADG